MYLVLEGLDGAGKSTQATKIANWLADKHNVYSTKEPGSRPYLPFNAREILLSGKLDRLATEYVLQAERVEHLRIVKNRLQAGEVVVSDRSFLSGAAYALAAGLDRSLVTALVKSIPVFPDLIIFFHLTPEQAINRILTRSLPDRIETLDNLKAVNSSFEEILWGPPEATGLPSTPILVVDAELSVEQIFQDIKAELETRLAC